MALQQKDKTGYKDPDSFSSYFTKELKAGGATPATGLAITGGISLLPALVYAFFSAPYGGLPAEDHDLYTGLFDQTKNYSYFSNNRIDKYDIYDGYFLMRNEIGYELYEVNSYDELRLSLVGNTQQAQEVLAQVTSVIEAQMQNIQDNAVRYGPYAVDETRFAECGYMSAPYEFAGQTERYQSKASKMDCEVRSGTAADRHEIIEEELDMWQEAATAIAANEAAYTINPEDIVPAEKEGFLTGFFANVAIASLAGSGLILGGTGVSAAVSSRRAKKNKKNTPKP